MNFRKSHWLALSSSSLAFLAGCGGGGDDEAGSPTAFSTVPSTLTVTALAPAAGGPPTGRCVSGYAGEVFVYGGIAPYRLDNTAPGALILNKTEVGDRGGSFIVTFTGQCIAPGLVVVVDKLDRQVSVSFNNNPAAAPAGVP